MQYNEGYEKDLIETFYNIVGSKYFLNKRVFITGASGLIGSAIADTLLAANKLLDSNFSIYLGGRNKDAMEKRYYNYAKESVDYTFVSYEAAEELSLDADIDYIIHCASNAHPDKFAEEPVETLMAAIIGTNNVLKFAKEHSAAVLYVSSSEVYGKKEVAEPYGEEEYLYIDILNPRACYPSSKRACETLCASYLKEYDVDVKVVRPGHIYGPCITASDSRANAQFARDVKEHKDIIMKSAGNQLRSYCYVLDCVSAMLSVLLVGKNGDAYNISNSDAIVTIRELAEMHAKLSGQRVVIEDPSSLEKTGYNLMTCSALNSDKLEGLGWRGLYNLERGVRRTLDLI